MLTFPDGQRGRVATIGHPPNDDCIEFCSHQRRFVAIFIYNFHIFIAI